MNCDTCKDLLIDYLAGELSAEDAALFETAVAACTECAETLSAYRRIYEAYDHLPELEVPEKMTAELLQAARSHSHVPEPWFQRLMSPSWGGLLAAAAIAGAATWVLTMDMAAPRQAESAAESAMASQVARADEPMEAEEEAAPAPAVVESPSATPSHQLGGDRPPPHATRDQAPAPEGTAVPGGAGLPLDATTVAYNEDPEDTEAAVPEVVEPVERSRSRDNRARGEREIGGSLGDEPRSEERSAGSERVPARQAPSRDRSATPAPEPEPEAEAEPTPAPAMAAAEEPEPTELAMAAPTARGGGEPEEDADRDAESATRTGVALDAASGASGALGEAQSDDDGVAAVDAYATGVAAYERGDYAGAIRSLEAHLAAGADREPALTRYYLGAAFYQRDRFAEARRHLEAYLRMDASGSRSGDAQALIDAIEVAQEPNRMRREAVDSFEMEVDESGR